jgi:membrane-associated phospholipid phosphatase
MEPFHRRGESTEAGAATAQVNRRFAVFLLLICTIALSAVAAGDGRLPGDVAIQRFVQRTPEPYFRWLADFGNWIGSSRVFAVIAAALAIALFAVRRRWEAVFLIAALAARSLNGVLKRLLDSPRPTSDLVRVTEIASSLGFPSGHAMGSTLGYGAIALIANHVIPDRRLRLGVQVACAITILIVGFGRIFVGAHWPSDVLGGYLWGALILSALHFGFDALRRRTGPVYSPRD